VTFRDMSNNRTNKHQWIVLDGDIDAEWIESMNTVMVRPPEEDEEKKKKNSPACRDRVEIA
jgi:hypothetical protein